MTAAVAMLSSCSPKAAQHNEVSQEIPDTPFPYTVTEETKNRPMSAASRRNFQYDGINPHENEFFTQFKYTKLEGFDYNNDDGTITRRDPSQILFENGKYYMWYTKRHTQVPPRGAKKCTDVIPSTDWDLADIWYATSEDGFKWDEQGKAVARPEKPKTGHRSLATPDILKWKGKYYLYYQAFDEPSGTKGDYCCISMASSDSPDGPWKRTDREVIPVGEKGAWDQYAVQDPHPLIRDGKLFIYYKSAFNRPDHLWVAQGLVTADNPEGPFKRHPLNPVTNSSHETCFFPFRDGVATISIFDGNEFNTVQWAKDGVNFEVMSVLSIPPKAIGQFSPDQFTDTKNGRGITWGLCHYINVNHGWEKYCTHLMRFDCDLNTEVHDKWMKSTREKYKEEVYYARGLSKHQRKMANQRTKKLQEEYKKTMNK